MDIILTTVYQFKNGYLMANPLQPKCAKVLEQEFGAFVVIATGTSKSGIPDIVACVNEEGYGGPGNPDGDYGAFYGFEIKWGNDTPSELQKRKINEIIDAGGKAYFIRSVEQLRKILIDQTPPQRYELKPKVIL